VSSVTTIAVPLITGIGGLLVGAGFSRVTSRNDQRRQRYAEALSAVEELRASADADAAAIAETQQRVTEIGHWLELDSVPVSNAFIDLRRAAIARPDHGSSTFSSARERFVAAAHAYSSWRLRRRFWLQARRKRLKDNLTA
jgi:hypothetical protein